MTKRGFAMKYRKYDVEAEGYGNPYQWKQNFHARLGLDVARDTLGARKPRDVLGVSLSATWREIKSAYRRLAHLHHPDKGGDAARFRDVQAAYEVLEYEFGK